MKKVVILIAILNCLFSVCDAQQFSTKLYLEDKNGEKDTLEVGYDSNATNGVDISLGEVVYTSPIDSTRFKAYIIGQCWLCNDFLLNPYYLRKQIMQPSAHYISEGSIPIVFPYESLPITISWNSSLFVDAERNHSLITDWIPNRWFDVSSDWSVTMANLKDVSSVQFPVASSELQLTNMKAQGFNYSKSGKQYPLKTIYLAFGDNKIMGINELQNDNQLQIYPSIVRNQLKIKNFTSQQIKSINIQSLDGKILQTIISSESEINCSALIKGIYFIAVELDNNIVYKKFIKE